MDSDDEFMSGLSSQDEDEDFGFTQESDDGSLGDGTVYCYGLRSWGSLKGLTFDSPRIRRGGTRCWVFTRQGPKTDQEGI